MEFSVQTLSYIFILLILFEVIHLILSFFLFRTIRNRRGPQGKPGEMGINA